jgi:hypothetical protein
MTSRQLAVIGRSVIGGAARFQGYRIWISVDPAPSLEPISQPEWWMYRSPKSVVVGKFG